MKTDNYTTDVEELSCPSLTEKDIEGIMQFSYWVEGVFLIGTAFFGILWNSIAIYILSSRMQMRKLMFNQLLLSLLCFDNCFLFLSILESFRRFSTNGEQKLVSEVHILLYPYFLYPMQSIALTSSIFMTVAIAFERCSAIRKPFNHRSSSIHGSHTDHCRRLIMYLIPVIFTAFLFNIPKFFESRAVRNQNGTLRIDTTELRENPYYSVYYSSIIRGFTLSFLPSVLLLILNYKIYRVMKSQPDVMGNQSIRGKEYQMERRKQENNLAVLMIVISVVFVACNIPRNYLNIYEISVIQRNEKCKEAGKHTFERWSLITSQFSNLLLVFNSSTNMILYCIMNKFFRDDFLHIIKGIVSCFVSCTCVYCRQQRDQSSFIHQPSIVSCQHNGTQINRNDCAVNRNSLRRESNPPCITNDVVETIETAF